MRKTEKSGTCFKSRIPSLASWSKETKRVVNKPRLFSCLLAELLFRSKPESDIMMIDDQVWTMIFCLKYGDQRNKVIYCLLQYTHSKRDLCWWECRVERKQVKAISWMCRGGKIGTKAEWLKEKMNENHTIKKCIQYRWQKWGRKDHKVIWRLSSSEKILITREREQNLRTSKKK